MRDQSGDVGGVAVNQIFIDARKGQRKMSQGTSEYLISQFLCRLVEQHGPSQTEFVQAVGYRNLERALRRVNPWLDDGAGFDLILKQIATRFPGDADDLHTALAQTTEMKTAESDAAFLEHCKSEEATFAPFVHVEGEATIPRGITIFGLTGGHERWTTIKIPKAILKLPVEKQLAALPERMEKYLQEHGGSCPFFGRVVGFKFVRLLDYFQFDRQGVLVGRVDRPFRTGYVEVSLR